MWFHWKNEKCHSLTSAALARNPTQCSFQPSADCLIGIHRCVCQECWQSCAVICIKQEEVQISLLLCVLLPSLHRKEKSARNPLEKKKKKRKNISWPCAVLHYRLNALHAWFDTFFSSLFSPAWIHSYKSNTICASPLFSLVFLWRILLKMSWQESRTAVWTFYLLWACDQWDLDLVLGWQRATTLPCGLTSWPIREA